MLQENTIRQLMSTRHLFYLAKQSIESGQSTALISGVNLLQDAIESFFGAASVKLEVGSVGKQFMESFKLINDKLQIKMPFKDDLEKLNKLRVNAKHYGLQPDKKETERLLVTMKEFLKGSVENIFKVDFWTINLLGLIEDEKIKDALNDAYHFMEEKKYYLCLVECRKVIFIAFESSYDISRVIGADESIASFFGLFTRAPYHARSKEYIENNVKDPFDYIAIDYSDLDSTLTKKKIDHDIFWNIRRGTPAVYKYPQSDDWLIARDLEMEENGSTEEHASYILEQTTEIALKLEESKRNAKFFGDGNFIVKLKPQGIKIYDKADRNSKVLFQVNIAELQVTEQLPGFDKEQYWKVSHFVRTEEKVKEEWYYGYIHNDDIDWS